MADLQPVQYTGICAALLDGAPHDLLGKVALHHDHVQAPKGMGYKAGIGGKKQLFSGGTALDQKSQGLGGVMLSLPWQYSP